MSPALAGRFFTTSTTWEAHLNLGGSQYEKSQAGCFPDQRETKAVEAPNWFLPEVSTLGWEGAGTEPGAGLPLCDELSHLPLSSLITEADLMSVPAVWWTSWLRLRW